MRATVETTQRIDGRVIEGACDWNETTWFSVALVVVVVRGLAWQCSHGRWSRHVDDKRENAEEETEREVIRDSCYKNIYWQMVTTGNNDNSKSGVLIL